MTRAQIIVMQDRIGATPDGFWGPKSIAAVQSHLRALMPKDANWPSQSQAALSGFYGAAGDESKLLNLDVAGLGVCYDGKPVRTIRCHERVADSLLRVIVDLACGPHAAIMATYAGVYNNRPMRGGSLPSLHARGAAIDLDPDTNRLSQSWPVSATMPLEIMEAFAREGWLAAGAFWGRDAMHFQATR
jgi:hypothetical protein